MEQLELAETIEAIRNELLRSIQNASSAEIQFPVGAVELEFHVGVTKSADARGGVKFWVVELGAGANYAQESIQKVKIILQPPVGKDNLPVRVGRPSEERP